MCNKSLLRILTVLSVAALISITVGFLLMYFIHHFDWTYWNAFNKHSIKMRHMCTLCSGTKTSSLHTTQCFLWSDEWFFHCRLSELSWTRSSLFLLRLKLSVQKHGTGSTMCVTSHSIILTQLKYLSYWNLQHQKHF